jgi:hypothetical protein
MPTVNTDSLMFVGAKVVEEESHTADVSSFLWELFFFDASAILLRLGGRVETGGSRDACRMGVLPLF